MFCTQIIILLFVAIKKTTIGYKKTLIKIIEKY